MKIPNYAQAVVPKSKIVLYLLNLAHPTGKSKATFFTRFGFSVAEWEKMATSLRWHIATYDVADTLATDEGVHYIIEGNLSSPDGRHPKVRTVWAIDSGSEFPRFITAYPLK